MNRYPFWKYLMVFASILLGLLYTLPNFFGETPAVQVSTNRQSISINNETETRLLAALQQAGIRNDGTILADNSLRIRFNNTETQIKARDVIEQSLGDGYITALNLVPNSPEWMAKLRANPMFLGLDLRGGVHFTMQVDMKAALQKTFERYAGDIRRELRRQQVRSSRQPHAPRRATHRSVRGSAASSAGTRS